MDADRVAQQFSLNETESLALSLAKLALMEADLEAESDCSDRVVKRDVIRRYADLLSSRLGTSGDNREDLDWLTARQLARSITANTEADLPDRLQRSIDEYGADAARYIVTSPDVTKTAFSLIEQRQRALVLLVELIAFYPWPSGTKWGTKLREETLHSLVDGFSAPVDAQLVDEVDRRLASSIRQLRRQSLDSKKFAYIAVGGAVAGLLTGGLAAPVVGGAIGTSMGLSGAAASSAGLALLGGGAVSAGGFGIAGGTVVIAGAAGAGTAGLSAAGTWLRGAEPDEGVVESAKLDVLFEYVILRHEQADELQRLVVQNLQAQIDELAQEVNDLTASLQETQHASAERDRLAQLLHEEKEKRLVLERTLNSLKSSAGEESGRHGS